MLLNSPHALPHVMETFPTHYHSLWQGPDEDKLASVETGGGCKCNECKHEKEFNAGWRVEILAPAGGLLPWD